MMTNKYYGVIMAGGGGTRLWPLSRRKRPKQTLRIIGERTLFQIAVDRILSLIPAERIMVVTVAEQAGMLQEQSPEIPLENYLIEPMPRGTASVIGLAAIVMANRDPESIMACLTADHYIANVDIFRCLLQAAYDVARDGNLVTLGITPTYPSTGFGYIQRGEPLGKYREHKVYRVKGFKEKPSLNIAERYLADKSYAWNSGMFVWKTTQILEEIDRQMPDLYRSLMDIKEALGDEREQKVIRRVWDGLASETIDYGVMEGARDVAVITADDLGWWDIGGWNRFWKIMKLDDDGNLVRADKTLMLDTRETLIFQDRETKKEESSARMIATLGVRDLIIVDTPDVLLICPRNRAEEIRKLVASLREKGDEQYL